MYRAWPEATDVGAETLGRVLSLCRCVAAIDSGLLLCYNGSVVDRAASPDRWRTSMTTRYNTAAIEARVVEALEQADGAAYDAHEALVADAGKGRMIGDGIMPDDDNAPAMLWAVIEDVCGL